MPELIAGTEAPALPWPRGPVTEDTKFFWEGLVAGELRIQRCMQCGTLQHPPRPCCPVCLSFDRDYVVSVGAGTIVSFVVYHYPPAPPLEPPYVVVLVELDEGTRIVGNVVGNDPETVSIGARVEVEFQTIEEGFVLPQWQIVSDGDRNE